MSNHEFAIDELRRREADWQKHMSEMADIRDKAKAVFDAHEAEVRGCTIKITQLHTAISLLESIGTMHLLAPRRAP